MDAVAYLLSPTYEQDEKKNFIAKEEEIEILCQITSVRQSEFFEAGKSGISAQLVVLTPTINYGGEKKIRIDKKVYGIYRTYEKGDMIELYCEEKGGL